MRTRVAAAMAPPPDDERVAISRSDLDAALDAITVAYEAAVDAAEDGVLEFAPFEGLAEAIRILRAALASEEMA